MAKLHKYPPAKDNPGRVSEGTARDMEKRAELAHQAPHEAYIKALRTQTSTKKQRRARKGK